MTLFIGIALIVWLLVVAVVCRPLLQRSSAGRRGWVSFGVILILLPLWGVFLYKKSSNWPWDDSQRALQSAGMPADIAGLVGKLESRLARSPDDVVGWMMLGRSAFVMKDFAKAVKAFSQAYQYSHHQNAEATVAYGVALVLADAQEFSPQADQLFAEALALDPQYPDALFYGALAARANGRLSEARQRWLALLAQKPSAEVATAVTERLHEVDQALGINQDLELAALVQAPVSVEEANPAVPLAKAAGVAPGPGVVTVTVSIDPSLRARVLPHTPLYVLVRDASTPGPPLAAKRLVDVTLPLVVSLSEADAMVPGHSLHSAQHGIIVVARYSASGNPIAQSGDLFGSVAYDLAQGKSTPLQINRQTP